MVRSFINTAHHSSCTHLWGVFWQFWIVGFYKDMVEVLSRLFFSLSYQIGAVCFLFSSAMSSLLMREFSIAFGENNLSKMAELFERNVPLLYSLAAFLSCFVAFQAENIVYIIAGESFTEGAVALTIMSFYPIHQTCGQINGSFLLATDQTNTV